MKLKGKWALVTGGGRGIGRGICLKLAEEGCNIAVNYTSNKAVARNTLLIKPNAPTSGKLGL